MEVFLSSLRPDHSSLEDIQGNWVKYLLQLSKVRQAIKLFDIFDNFLFFYFLNKWYFLLHAYMLQGTRIYIARLNNGISSTTRVTIGICKYWYWFIQRQNGNQLWAIMKAIQVISTVMKCQLSFACTIVFPFAPIFVFVFTYLINEVAVDPCSIYSTIRQIVLDHITLK